MDKIIKRNNKTVKFNSNKIVKAIEKAGKSTKEFNLIEAIRLTSDVVKILKSYMEIPTVENIQDIIEKVLMKSNYTETAKAFILYRQQRAKIREFESIDKINLMDQYLDQLDWRVNENSNSTFSIQGLNNYISSGISENYWLNKIYTDEIKKAHMNGDLHIHDLGSISSYCSGWDLQDLLIQGFRGVSGKIESNPPKHFRSALGQIVNFLFTLQGETAGAVSFSNFDTLLSPFIRYDNLDYLSVKQAIQEFVFNMNVSTRASGQSPFSNITLDLNIPNHYKDQPIIIGGELQNETYKEFQEEMNLFNKAFFEVMMEGDAKNRVFTFPIPTYNITKEFDWDNPNLDGLWEMTAKYGIPYFSNFINSDMKPEDTKSMCPLSCDTEVLIKCRNKIKISKIKDIVKRMKNKKTKYEVFINNKWVKTSPVIVPMTDVYEIKLSNGSIIQMGKNHLQPTLESGTVRCEELTTNDWLPFNKDKIKTSDIGSYDLGFCVGAYIGDGSHDKKSVTYSLCGASKSDFVEEKIVSFWKNFGFDVRVDFTKNIRFIRINGDAYNIISKYIDGNNALNKKMLDSIYNMSIECRQGILDGLISTDGARSRKRIYTSSLEMKKNILFLLNSLGLKGLSNYEDNRDGRLGKNTNYRIDYPSRENYGELYKEDDKYFYYKIVSINKIDTKHKSLYCFEVDSDDNLFMLANGLITHNCRLKLSLKEINKRGGGIFASYPLTGSICVTTINLAKIGYLSSTEKEFKNKLEKQLILAKEISEIKRSVLENLTDKNLYPYSKYYLQNIKLRDGKYWSNHFSTIGIIGMNEACLNLFNENISTKKSINFALEIMDFILEKTRQFKEETGNNYNLEATPAEGTNYRLARLDKENYKDIKFFNDSEIPIYTNSTQLPINYSDDIFEVLEKQDELQTKYTGGSTIHFYLGERTKKEQIKKLTKLICENYKLPYFSFTPTFSICSEHGYLNGEVENCPKCNNKCEIYSRVVGYLRPVNQWNKGKQEEFKLRKVFNIGE